MAPLPDVSSIRHFLPSQTGAALAALPRLGIRPQLAGKGLLCYYPLLRVV